MKKLLAAVIALCFCGAALAQLGTDNSYYGMNFSGTGFYVHAYNAAIGTTYELLAEDDDYAVLGDTDKIEVISADAGDAQRVRLFGVNKADTTRKYLYVRLNGTTAVASSDSFFAFVDAIIDSGGEAAGKITIRDASGDALISSIAAGGLKSYNALQFIPERRQGYVTGFYGGTADSTGSVTFQLRYYPDYADYRDAGDGYILVAPPVVLPAYERDFNIPFPQPVVVGGRKGGFLMLYVKSNLANASAYGGFTGFTR